MKLILASTSPRRREILELLGLTFEVMAPEFCEQLSSHRRLEDEVLEFAVGKAASVAKNHRHSLVIGSDTMIDVDGRKIGKPHNMADGKKILRALAGKRHRILTSVALLDDLGGPGLRVVEEVSVKMRAYSHDEIEAYMARNESLDKAGAYSIQGHGRALIESIEGDYLAAVGLPLKPIADYLQSRDITIPLNVDKLYADRSFRNWRSF